MAIAMHRIEVACWCARGLHEMEFYGMNQSVPVGIKDDLFATTIKEGRG